MWQVKGGVIRYQRRSDQKIMMELPLGAEPLLPPEEVMSDSGRFKQEEFKESLYPDVGSVPLRWLLQQSPLKIDGVREQFWLIPSSLLCSQLLLRPD